jgi:hypothetical protein
MKSAPQVTDGPASAGPRVADVIGTRSRSAFGTGTPSTGAAKTSDKRGLSVPNVGLAVVLGGVGILNPRVIPNVASLVPVAAGLDGGVTNTSTETSRPTQGQKVGYVRSQNCCQNLIHLNCYNFILPRLTYSA